MPCILLHCGQFGASVQLICTRDYLRNNFEGDIEHNTGVAAVDTNSPRVCALFRERTVACRLGTSHTPCINTACRQYEGDSAELLQPPQTRSGEKNGFACMELDCVMRGNRCDGLVSSVARSGSGNRSARRMHVFSFGLAKQNAKVMA